MRSFTDNAGRVWTVAITVDSLRRVQALTGVQLLSAVEDQGALLGRLSSDPILLCDVLYAACKPQADAAKVSDEDFGRAMAGDAIEAATAALLEDLVDFFPLQRRTVFRRALEKVTAARTLAARRALAILDGPEMDAEIARRIDEAMPPPRGTPVSSAPASPA